MSSVFILRDKQGQDTEPLSTEQVRAWMKDKRCHFFTPARRVEDAAWKMVGSFKEFSRAEMAEAEARMQQAPELPATTGSQIRAEAMPSVETPAPPVAPTPPPRVATLPVSPGQTQSPFPGYPGLAVKPATPLRTSSPPPVEAPQYTYDTPARQDVSERDEFEIPSWVNIVWLVIMGGLWLVEALLVLVAGDFIGLGKLVLGIFWRCLIYYGIPKGIAWITWRLSGESNRFVPAAFLVSFFGLLGVSILAMILMAIAAASVMTEMEHEMQTQPHTEEAQPDTEDADDVSLVPWPVYYRDYKFLC